MYKISFAVQAFLLALCLQPNAQSVEESTLVLTVDQAVQRALDENRSLRAARKVVEQVEWRAQTQGRLNAPQLMLSYSNDFLFNDEGEQSFEFGFKQSFPITNRLRFEKELGEAAIELAKAEIKVREHALARDVELLIVELTAFDSQMALRQGLIDLDERFSTFIASRIELGEASSIEANQVEIALFALRQSQQELQNEKAELLAELKLLLGVEVETVLEIDSKFDLHSESGPLPVFNDEMLRTHPEFHLKSLMAEIAESKTSLANSKKWQDIVVSVFWEDERGVDEPTGLGNDQFLGFGISIPLPRKKYTAGAIKESVAYEQQVAMELDATRFKLKNRANALRQKSIRLEEQADSFHSELLGLLDKNVREMNTAYSQGLVSLNTLFQAQEQRLNIESTHYSHIIEHQRSLVEWRYAASQNESASGR